MKRAVRLVSSIVKNRIGAVPRPSWCTYLVCQMCNASCGMCDSWKLKRGRELSPDEVRTVFAKIGPLDVVRLSGGEPFLRKDMLDVSRAVMEASDPQVLHITTNGSYPDRIETLVRGFDWPRRLRIMVSLDGTRETHDRSRGKHVTFDRALESIRAIKAVGGGVGVTVSVNHTVISTESLRQAPELARLFGQLGVDVQAVLAYSDSAMYGQSRHGSKAEDLIIAGGYPLHPDIDEQEAIAFVDAELARVDRIEDVALRVGKRYYLAGLKGRLTGTSDKPKPRCTALRSHIRLLPDGRVPVCQFNTEVVGNLLEQSFDEIWHHQAVASRAWVDRCAGCWAECEVMPSAIYGGDIARALKLPGIRLWPPNRGAEPTGQRG